MWKDMYTTVIPVGGLLVPKTRLLASSSLLWCQTAYGSTYPWTLTPLIRTNTGITMCWSSWTTCQRNLFLFPVTRQLLLRKWPPYSFTTCGATLALQTLLSQIMALSSFQPFRLSSVKYLVLRLSYLQPTTLKLTARLRL